MNKDKLIQLKRELELLEEQQENLAERKETFNQQNASLIEHISQLKMSIDDCKAILKENAEVEYEKTGDKKLLGGIGIRISTQLTYDEKEALEWAKNHQLCLTLNKKEFETLAKIQEIGFVKKQEKITVTFPKEIVIEE